MEHTRTNPPAESAVPFIYTADEAAAAARHELGTGQLPYVLSMLLAAGFLGTLLLRTALGMPLLPPFSVLAAYAAAVAAWCIFMVYIRIRLRQTAAALCRRSFTLYTTAQGFSVLEFDADSRYHADFAQVTACRADGPVLCIDAPMGRICLPARIFDAAQLLALQQQNGRGRQH